MLSIPFPSLLAVVACGLIVGCGGGDSNRAAVSGKVTFKGKPVPEGKIYFSPDTDKKNTGPQGFADIRDGVYDTSRSGKGAPSGPVVVQIEGYDGNPVGDFALGKPLFLDYRITDELPTSSTTKNYDVPASAGKKLPKFSDKAP